MIRHKVVINKEEDNTMMAYMPIKYRLEMMLREQNYNYCNDDSCDDCNNDSLTCADEE